MFYSQCILSRKGPWKSIWVAAYCHKRLSKEQVSNTDISSSVDEIMLNEFTASYRILAYLLLGVVRIYSKKVEYLYHDCNETFSRVNSFVPLKKLKEGMCAPYSSITLPERFELDGFDLELPEDIGGNMETHQQITLEGRSETAGQKHYSLNKYFHDLDLAHLDGDAVYTPIREALSPHLLENYVVVYPTDYDTLLEFGTEKLPREEFPNIGINLGSNEPVELGTQCNKVDSRIEIERILEVTPSDHGKSGSLGKGDTLAVITDDHGKSGSLGEDDTLAGITDDHGKSGSLGEGDTLAGKTDETPKRSRLPNNTDFGRNCGDAEPMVIRTPSNEVSNRAKRIRFMDITPPPIVCTNDRTCQDSNFSCDTGASTPERVSVSTPAKMEQPRFSRKRKQVLDDTVVLSNVVMKQNLNDPSSLVVKRNRVPLTALDVWETYKLPNFYQDFMEPLIYCTTQLNTLFRKSSFETPQLFESSEAHVEDEHDINREYSEDRAHSDRNTVDYSTWNSIGSPTTSKSDMEIPVDSVFQREGDVPEAEAQDIGLNLIDEDLGPCQVDDKKNQNAWSTRTRKVATFLCKSFLNQKDQESGVLNLKPVLETKTRKENARLFYEILVLKSQGFVEVQQETPYGDIYVQSTSQLMEVV